MDSNQLWLSVKKFRYEVIAVIFTAYGVYLRFVSLSNREFWVDEQFSIQMMRGPFKQFWRRLEYADFTHFPGEYIVNSPFVFFFKTNKWGISIPHILFTLLGFYLLYLICERYLRSALAWASTFALVAIHRELIFHSFELRQYAVLPTLALAAFYFSEEIISNRYHLSLARKILIGFSFIFTIIYNVFGAIILSCVAAYFVLCESGERTFKEVFKHSYRFMGVMIIIGLPLFLWYAVDAPCMAKGIGRNIFEYMPDPAVNIFGFIKTVLCCLIGSKILYILAVFLVFPFILPYRERLRQIYFLLILVILPVMITLYISFLVRYWFVQRQFIWVMPLFAFLIGWCLDSLIVFYKQKVKGTER